MKRTPFYRPMIGGFAVTAIALLLAPGARAASDAASSCDMPAPAPKAHGLKLGHLLSAARGAGMGQMIGGSGLGAMGGALGVVSGGLVVGMIANAAIDAAGKAHAGTGHPIDIACEQAGG